MNVFKDKNGTTWEIEINVGSIKRVMALTGVNLIDAIKVDENGVDGDRLVEISNDACLLVDILYTLCKAQAVNRNISEQDFAELFDMDAFINASDAFVQEVINFSQPARRKMLTMIFDRSRKARAMLEQEVINAMENKEFVAELDARLNELYTSTPE